MVLGFFAIVAAKDYLCIRSEPLQRHIHQQNKHIMDTKETKKIQEPAFITRHAFIITILKILMMHFSEFSL